MASRRCCDARRCSLTATLANATTAAAKTASCRPMSSLHWLTPNWGRLFASFCAACKPEARGPTARPSAPPEVVHELVSAGGLLEQLVAGLAGEGLEVDRKSTR